MCTAISYKTKHHYFGRNLDIDKTFGEGVVVTPGRFPLSFRKVPALPQHYAMIGMGVVCEDYPLYFEATNEKGLSMAGLNFPGNAYYGPYENGKENVASFELIPYILGQCVSVGEGRALLERIHVIDLSFNDKFFPTPLHWLLSDSDHCLVVEATKEGLQLYENPFCVLTNNPPFPFHRENMHRYMGLHEGLGQNTLSASLPLENTSVGFGAMGLPGDFSSASRFVKAVYVKEKSPKDLEDQESVCQFFHILNSVAMVKGCVRMESGNYEYTRYSCCCNTETGEYYYTTYEDPTIRKVPLLPLHRTQSQISYFPI